MKIVFRLSTARSDDVQDRSGPRAVGLDERPRRLVGDVLVDGRREPHRLAERRAEATRLEMRADRVEARRRPPSSTAWSLGGQRARLRDGAEVAVGVRQRPVDEVAPVREQLVVVAPHELGPGEVGVLRLRARRRSGSSEAGRGRSGRGSRADRSSGRGSSRTACPPWSGTRSRRRCRAGGAASPAPYSPPFAVAEEDRRPDHGVEDDVVLPLEVGVHGVGVLPPVAPRVRVAARARAHSMLADR